MRKVTPEQIAQKREEIINACEQLYQTMSFREITLKEIGNITSFSRPTIYNYFETKEEIFPGLFQREYDRWNENLTAILNRNDQLTKKELADVYTFYPFMFGIYPYTAVTDKQRAAMKEAGINYVYQSVYELTYSCLIRLLG